MDIVIMMFQASIHSIRRIREASACLEKKRLDLFHPLAERTGMFEFARAIVAHGNEPPGTKAGNRLSARWRFRSGRSWIVRADSWISEGGFQAALQDRALQPDGTPRRSSARWTRPMSRSRPRSSLGGRGREGGMEPSRDGSVVLSVLS